MIFKELPTKSFIEISMERKYQTFSQRYQMRINFTTKYTMEIKSKKALIIFGIKIPIKIRTIILESNYILMLSPLRILLLGITTISRNLNQEQCYRDLRLKRIIWIIILLEIPIERAQYRMCLNKCRILLILVNLELDNNLGMEEMLLHSCDFII